MNDYVIYICDTETTGLDPVENDVIEVSFWRLSDNEQKTWCIRALNPETISDKALQVNKHNRDDILRKTAFGKETYREPADVVSEIEVWMMGDGASIGDRVFLGQNPQFDFDFLKQLWKKANASHSFPFSNFIIDTIQMTRFIDLCTGKRRQRYNLGSLVKDFGVTKGKAHKAAEDVKMTKDLFLKQYEPIRDHVAEQFKDSYK